MGASTPARRATEVSLSPNRVRNTGPPVCTEEIGPILKRSDLSWKGYASRDAPFKS